LVFSRSSQDLDDFNELVYSTLSRENRLANHEFSNDTADRPNVNLRGVIGVPKNEFRSSVISGADIGHIWLSLDELFGASEVTHFQGVRRGIDEHILRLDVSMANADSVDVGNGSEHLVGVEFDHETWDWLLHLEELLHYFVDGVGDEVHHHVEVYLIWVITVSVEVLSHLHAVRVVQHFQNLELPVLVTLVLEHLLYCHVLSCLCHDRFEHHSEGTISNDLLSIVGKASLLASKGKLIYRLLLGFARLVLDFHFVNLVVKLLDYSSFGLFNSLCSLLHAG